MPDIAWRRVIGLRNILAHGYEHVAHEILWHTIARDLPTLEDALAHALRGASRRLQTALICNENRSGSLSWTESRKPFSLNRGKGAPHAPKS